VPLWIVALAAAAVCAVAVILQGDALGVPWWLALIVLVTPLVVVAVLAAMRGGDDTKIL
jgi:small basic protein